MAMNKKVEKEVNLQDGMSASVIILNCSGTTEMNNCFVYANDNDDKGEMIIMLQDAHDAKKRVQITITKKTN